MSMSMVIILTLYPGLLYTSQQQFPSATRTVLAGRGFIRLLEFWNVKTMSSMLRRYDKICSEYALYLWRITLALGIIYESDEKDQVKLDQEMDGHCHSSSSCWSQQYLCFDAHLKCPETDRSVREALKTHWAYQMGIRVALCYLAIRVNAE